MDSIKEIISGQPLIAAAIILVLLLVVIFIGAKSGVQRFTRKKEGKTLDNEDEKKLNRLINEIHDTQKM